MGGACSICLDPVGGGRGRSTPSCNAATSPTRLQQIFGTERTPENHNLSNLPPVEQEEVRSKRRNLGLEDSMDEDFVRYFPLQLLKSLMRRVYRDSRQRPWGTICSSHRPVERGLC